MGGGGGEGGGERARARPHLQLVRVLARHACAGRGGATAWTGRGGPTQRLQQLSKEHTTWALPSADDMNHDDCTTRILPVDQYVSNEYTHIPIYYVTLVYCVHA